VLDHCELGHAVLGHGAYLLTTRLKLISQC
jgi:hypothetical protein